VTNSTPELDGFESLRPDATAMEKAAHRIIGKLRAEGLLHDEHDLIAQTIVELSRAVGISAQSGKAAGMAMAAKELREFMTLLPAAEDDDLTRELRAIEAESERARAAAAKATK
jgi:hypothetical protein